jgi:helicase
LEVAFNDIKKRLATPYSLLIRDSKQEDATWIGLYPADLKDRHHSDLSGMIEWGKKQSGLMEILRSWFIKYNKPVYFQPKEFREILMNAEHIIIPKGHEPSLLESLREFFKRFQIDGPLIVPLCEHCLSENRLTILSRKNAVKISDTQVLCLTCARSDLRTELHSHGVEMSKSMTRQLEQQLARVKSVPRIIGMLFSDFDPTSEPQLTLFDKIKGEITGKGKKITTLPIPKEFQDIILEIGIDKLLPVQEIAIENGLLKGNNLLIVSSTSSGKTLIGELTGVPKALKGKKMIYLSPLVALTNEKYELWRKRYKPLGLRVGIKVGMSRIDVGEEARSIVDTNVSKADIICATYEALDLIFRSQEVSKIGEIGTIIVDEIQNLAEPERGPELDGLLARMRYHAPKAQVIALSATVGSPQNLAKELELKLIDYTGRPVPLERHLVFARNDEQKRSIIKKIVQSEFRNVSSTGNKGQSIVFTFSRRRSHSISDWLRNNYVKSTVYHGGLTYNRKRRLEASYNKQRYACVVTTAALGSGVDLPASQVIFESLAMGANWLSNSEYEQMLGRAGRLGKHDRGKVYLIVEPGRKYHGGQDKYEDEIAVELLNGVVEDVEPFADTETSAEQVLATICSTGLSDIKTIAKIYNKMLSTSIEVVDALKFLVKKHMIRVRQGGVYPTELGKATALSFLTPSEGFEVRNLLGKLNLLEIAIDLEPFENVYLSSKLQSEVNSAFKTFMPTRLFSGVFSDLTDLRKPHSGASRLPSWVFELFTRWTKDFFNCGCKYFPECNHGKINVGKWMVERRHDGLNPTGIAKKLRSEYELWAYPGDIYSWLDTLIHNLQAVKRVAKIAGKTDISEEIETQIERIERPFKQNGHKKRKG